MSQPGPASIHFGSANCSLEIENANFKHLINDKIHPDASPRFGTHFLAFPLLHVNRHLRQRTGKLLYNLAFQTKVPSLIYEDVAPTSRSCLIFTNSTICHQNGAMEDDDPRSILDYNAANLDTMPKTFSATGFEVGSPQLYVRFEEGKTGQKFMAGMFHRNIGENDEGLENVEFPLFLQIVSSAWFDKAQGPPPHFPTLSVTKSGEPNAVQARAYDRHGYKAAVLVPRRPDGQFYDISLPAFLHPEWATSGKPDSKKYQDIGVWDGGWRFTYRTELVGFDDDEDDEDLAVLAEMAKQDLEEMNRHNGFISTPSRMDLELVKVPLLDPSASGL